MTSTAGPSLRRAGLLVAVAGGLALLGTGCGTTTHVSSTPSLPAPSTRPASGGPASSPARATGATNPTSSPPSQPAGGATSAGASTSSGAPGAGAGAGSPPAAIADAQSRLSQLDAGVTQVSDDLSSADQAIANGG